MTRKESGREENIIAETRKQQTRREKKIYYTRNGAPFKKKDAQAIGEFIEKCRNRSTRGILKEIKRNPKHPIYSYIEWNDKRASELFRLQQIRNIVNHIEIEIAGINNEIPIRAFYSITSITNGGESYKGLNEVFSNEKFRNQIIEAAKIELKNWIERYKIYQELQGICRIISRKLKYQKLTGQNTHKSEENKS